MASSLKKILCQWLDKVVLHTLLKLWPDTRIWEIDTNNQENKYSYLYHMYYPEDLSKEPIGAIFHQDKFHQFYHLTTIENPYLGAVLKEVNQYKFQDDVSTEEEQGAEEQPTLQIYQLLVMID